MLDLMRKHAGTWMIKALLGAIVVVFIFWGVGSWTTHREGILATVNGEPISIEEYRNTYNRLLDQARQSLGAGLSEELLKSMELERSAMDQLIDRALLKQAAVRFKLRVSDEELAQSVRSITAFHSNGSFDPRRYQQILAVNRMTPDLFESSQRDALLIDKLNRLVTGSVKVPDSEVEQWYLWNNSTVKIDFVSIDGERYKNVSVTAEEIADYYERTKESYRTPPAVQVRYLRFKPEDFMEKVSVTDEEVRDFYDANPERFVVPKTVEARHILIRVPAEAPPEAVDKARDRILDVLKQAREGKDFAELAKQYSEDTATKERGGELGAFPKEAMVQPFAEAAFALQPGRISEPVKTRFGWHIIKVEKVNEGRTLSLEEAKAEIQNQLKRERARNMAYDQADAVYEAALGANDLSAAAAAHKVEVHTTDFFPRSGPVKGITQATQFAQAAFQLSAGDISDIQDLGDGYYLLQLVEMRPARIPELAAVEGDVKRDLIKEKQAEMAKKEAQGLLQDVQSGTALEQAAQQIGAERRTSDFLKRTDSIAGLGYEPEMVRMAFELSDQKPLPSEPVRTSKGYAVIRFVERKAPSPEGLEKERAQIRQRLLQQKKFKTWEAWMDRLRQQGEIVRRTDFAKI